MRILDWKREVRAKYCFSIFFRGCNQSNLSTFYGFKYRAFLKKKKGKVLKYFNTLPMPIIIKITVWVHVVPSDRNYIKQYQIRTLNILWIYFLYTSYMKSYSKCIQNEFKRYPNVGLDPELDKWWRGWSIVFIVLKGGSSRVQKGVFLYKLIAGVKIRWAIVIILSCRGRRVQGLTPVSSWW
jgi:hypothetical protein